MSNTNNRAEQLKSSQQVIETNCKPFFSDFVPATEWSVLAIIAIFLVRYIIRINAKLLEEVCEDDD